jgi:hypothetical protein
MTTTGCGGLICWGSCCGGILGACERDPRSVSSSANSPPKVEPDLPTKPTSGPGMGSRVRERFAGVDTRSFEPGQRVEQVRAMEFPE